MKLNTIYCHILLNLSICSYFHLASAKINIGISELGVVWNLYVVSWAIKYLMTCNQIIWFNTFNQKEVKQKWFRRSLINILIGNSWRQMCFCLIYFTSWCLVRFGITLKSTCHMSENPNHMVIQELIRSLRYKSDIKFLTDRAVIEVPSTIV